MREFWIAILLAVHISGAIRPATTKDSQERCGSVLCQKIDEVFSQTALNDDYNYVTTIPEGAMNITIKHLSKTHNLIVLKSPDGNYIINGNKKISESGIFEYNNDVYDYNKEKGVVKAKGPLHKALLLIILAFSSNPGLRYTYFIPVSTASVTEKEELQSQWNELGQPLDVIDDSYLEQRKKRRQFSWKLLGFGPCSRSCGPGLQSPIFRCIRDSPNRYYTPRRCAHLEKPQFSMDIYHCSRGLCPPYWRGEEYGDCQCLEGAVKGFKKLQMVCVQEEANGHLQVIDGKNCSHEKPSDLKETCDCPKVIKKKVHIRSSNNTEKNHSVLKSKPQALRAAIPKRSVNISSITSQEQRFYRDGQSDKMGVWLMSEWNQQCSQDCSISFEHRTIYCDRTAPYTDLCDIRFAPTQKRTCSSRPPTLCQHGIWFTSEWSNCTGECFQLQRKRVALCMLDGLAVDEDKCITSLKPETVRNCTQEDVDFCGSKWHYSEWSKCSRTCGDGVQRRYAKCLVYDSQQNVMTESNQCKNVQREPVYGICNLGKCKEINMQTNTEGKEPFMLNDKAMDVTTKLVGVKRGTKLSINSKEKLVIAAAPRTIRNCNDELNNCKRINRERLCKLDYYKKHCCLTCHGYH
uniref:PLAC domain-containing protein n=1 Tax=Glossina brevipalpis TaxID=37001 RepID=A0A1A9W6U5_9MUSC